ncbi:MAG: tyrosine-type recombinase/integrase [Nanoarchaeota archaeon]|nr:tyrosine-type recombinase/integrase [Nanoarchaeota archaeon]
MRDHKLPKYLSRSELIMLGNAIHQPRIMVAVVAGLFFGLRGGEVVRLKKSSFNFEKMEIEVLDSKNPKRTKQGYGKDRVIPIINKNIEPFFQQYFENVSGDFLFPGKDNKYKSPHICLNTFEEYFATVLKRANLYQVVGQRSDGRNIYKYRFHSLRHTVGTTLINNGANIEEVMEFLGHSDISSTLIYAKLAKKPLRKKLSGIFNKKKQRNYAKVEETSGNGVVDKKIELLKLQNENLRLKENSRIKTQLI